MKRLKVSASAESSSTWIRKSGDHLNLVLKRKRIIFRLTQLIYSHQRLIYKTVNFIWLELKPVCKYKIEKCTNKTPLLLLFKYRPHLRSMYLKKNLFCNLIVQVNYIRYSLPYFRLILNIVNYTIIFLNFI